MGEYSVEVRRESFYLRGEDCYEAENNGGAYPRHVIYHYGTRAGTVEILIEDIPKIRAALDQVERISKEGKDQ